MSELFTYTIGDVPDLDQRWRALPGDGKNYCVPTSTMNWMYYLAKHGRPGAVKFSADTNNPGMILINLLAMASYMGTDPADGTSAGGGFDGLNNWLHDRQMAPTSPITTSKAWPGQMRS
jgi:hypothetical protein